jgi:hypothetical protein
MRSRRRDPAYLFQNGLCLVQTMLSVSFLVDFKAVMDA